MPTETPMLPVRIALSGPGRGTVEVNGQDLSNFVRSFDVHAAVGELQTLTLQLNAWDDINIEGAMRVEAWTERDWDAATAVREMDPDELKGEALASAGLGQTDVVAAVLELVAQRLERRE